MTAILQAAQHAAADVSADPVSYQQYVDFDAFTAVAKPLLHQDLVRNTLCLTHLDSMINSSSSDSNSSKGTLALLSCSTCNISTVLVAVDSPATGDATCYVSSGPCSHIVQQLAAVLQQQLGHCGKVTLTAAAAEQLQNAQAAQVIDKWQLDFPLQLMVYDSSSDASVSRARQQAATAGPTTAAGCSNAEHHHQQQQQQQQLLQLRQCTESDAALVVSWSATFLQEVFELPERPTDAQVAVNVLPRLKHGLYFMLTDTAGSGSRGSGSSTSSSPVCMLSHTPASDSSTRVTMVYTPAEHRGHGHAKTAVRQLLERLEHQLGYNSICLFADRDKPHIGTMYQGLGFRYFDELHTLKRPARDAADASQN